MTPKRLSFAEAFLFSVREFGSHLGFFLKFALLFSAVYVGLCILFVLIASLGGATSSLQEQFFINPQDPLWLILLTICFHLTLFVLGELYYYQILRAGFSLYKKNVRENSARTLPSVNLQAPGFFSFLLAQWTYSLKVFLGFVLFVIPAFYFALTYYFTGFPLTEGAASTIADDANQAKNLAEKVRFRLLLFSCFVALIGLVIGFGLLPLAIAQFTAHLSETVRMVINLALWHIFSTFLSPLKQLMEVSLYQQLKAHI